MIGYEDWEYLQLSVDNIKLDPRNPRLPEDVMGSTQPKIRHYLVDNFQVLEIAKNIAKFGFFPTEQVIVVREKKHFVVVEGNRRVAALQLLRNPSLAPPRKISTYRKLAENIDTGVLQKLPMYVAPSREAAAPILIARHASDMTSSWKRLMKNRYLVDAVLRGRSYEDVAEAYGVSRDEVRTAAIETILREMVIESDIDLEIREKIIDYSFPLSTVSRIVKSQLFTDITGMELDGTKIITSKINQKGFMKILTRIFTDLTNPEFNSRYFGKKDKDITPYIREISDKYSGETGKSCYTPKPPADQLAEPEHKPKPRARTEMLIPDTRKFYTGLSKLDHLIVTAQKMRLGYAPVAGAFVLRAIFELSLIRLFDLHGKLDEVYHSSGMTKPASVLARTLSSQREWFEKDSIRKKLLQFVDPENPRYMHIETLHGYVHGIFQEPDKKDLEQFWKHIQPIVEMCLEEED
ncbi:hypothetical protein [Desulfovibrio sp.]|uniref:hypothetical protein n=1 Tax=Desulfovibrio sp. TaxID=885 RepID=UPI0025BC0275|nr:hypothetical protein [Desulfovibrio sp.]